MKKIKELLFGIIIFPAFILWIDMTAANGQTSQVKQPYTISHPAEDPVLFGENLISTAEDELNSVFSPDGQSIYFSKNLPVNLQGVILVSHFGKGKWGKPEVASFSGRYSDYDPFFSHDGSKLFFISNRPLTGTAPKKDYDIWVVEKSGSSWGEPRNLGAPINTDRNEYYPSVAADGTLYFSTVRPGGKGSFDVYFSRYVDGKYTEPQNLGAANTQFPEIDNFISPDQSFIIFASYGRPDSLGSGDFYISYNRNGSWTPAVNLGAPINSSAREYCPMVSPDGKYFFFTSERGFADVPPAKPYTLQIIEQNLKTVLNGLGNIYQIDIAAIKLK